MSLDPKFKFTVAEMLEDFIYGKIKQHWEKELTSIIDENNKIHGKLESVGFWYKTDIYLKPGFISTVEAKKLSPKLYESMDEYLNQKKTIENNEKVYVMGYIVKSLNLSNNVNDYFELLPEVIHEHLKRIHESQFTTAIARLPRDVVNAHYYGHTKEINLLKSRLVSNLLI
jgi:predicted nucleotidyltransferase